MTIDLKKYGPLLSDKKIGDEIYQEIRINLDKATIINIDFKYITSMATFCAKQIFGKLYIEMGSEKFFERIKLMNANEDLKIIIKMGIQNALDEDSRK